MGTEIEVDPLTALPFLALLLTSSVGRVEATDNKRKNRMKTVGLGIVGSGYMGRTYAHCVRDHNEGAELVVQTVLDSIVEALNSDDKVELRGFGSFGHRKRNPVRGATQRRVKLSRFRPNRFPISDLAWG